MVLFEFANVLKRALSAGRPPHSVLNAGTADSALLNALHGRLGSEPEALNKLSLIGHCVDVAKSVQTASKIMPAELISAMLGYFMLRTVAPHTFGLIWCTREHPLLSLAERDPDLGLTIVDANGKIIGEKKARLTDLRQDEKRISTAILILKDARDADVFREQALRPLTARVAANGIDILAVANKPEIATAATSVISCRGKIQAVDFPDIASGLGLNGISLRCILFT